MAIPSDKHPAKLCERYHHAVELLGRRWAGAIVRILLDGPARYNELRAAIPEISDRMLAERLRELESERVLTRTVFPEVPVRVQYSLTEKGRALDEAIMAIGRWAEQWVGLADLEVAGRPMPTPTRRGRPASTSSAVSPAARLRRPHRRSGSAGHRS